MLSFIKISSESAFKPFQQMVAIHRLNDIAVTNDNKGHRSRDRNCSRYI